MRRHLLLTSVFASVIASGSISNAQTTCTFDPTGFTGVWHDEANWTCNKIPEAGDTVIILSGYSCVIEDYDEAAFVIEIEDDGELQVISQTLQLGDSDDYSDCTIDGRVLLDGGVLEVQEGSIFVFGEGSIEGAGTITRSASPGSLVVVDGPFTFDGSLTFLASVLVDLFGEAAFNVGSGDTMNFGYASAPDPYITFIGYGYATLNVSGGTARIRRTVLSSQTWDFFLSSGVISLQTGLIATSSSANVEITGGTFTTAVNLGMKDLKFHGGTITVAPNKSATFAH